MWMELLDIFRGSDVLKSLGDDFISMIETTHEMATLVHPHVFDHSLPLERRSQIYTLDVRVNKLERSVRKRILAHLSLQSSNAPYCLLLMTLAKDAERIGDYVKNVTEVAELGGSPLPEGPLRVELAQLIDIAMELFGAAKEIITEQDRERATELLQKGRHAGKRCDRLLVELAKSDLTPAETTSMVLLTRFYKRIGAHLVNILSSVVMPVHKVDFFDEREIEEGAVKGV